jgi:uncharacterized membrane protein YsdA (DUF1294 family)
MAPAGAGTASGAFFSAGFLAFTVVMAFLQRVPAGVPFVYAGVSLLTFAVYRADKEKAVRGEWRTPESTLHLLELLGGWPGALVAQQVLRHKNRKATFQVAFWAIVAVHIAALVGVLSRNPLGVPAI